jgi:SMC interacting uncharacterized protein involved in chromosome segregation
MTLKSYIVPEQDYNKLKAKNKALKAKNKTLNKLVLNLNKEVNQKDRKIEEIVSRYTDLIHESEKQIISYLIIIIILYILSAISIFI